jgi:hypothetical protein
MEFQRQGSGKVSRRSEGFRAAGTGLITKDGVMREIRVMILAVSLLLLVCGCTGFRRAGKTSMPADWDTGQSQSSKPADPKSSPPSPCLERQGFAVFGFRAIRDSYDRVSVVGEVKNTGFGARGVELQASLRDAGGRLVAVGHVCPASNRNITPDEIWPFTYSFGIQEDAVEAELRIIGSFHTTDILNAPLTSR